MLVFPTSLCSVLHGGTDGDSWYLNAGSLSVSEWGGGKEPKLGHMVTRLLDYLFIGVAGSPFSAEAF